MRANANNMDTGVRYAKALNYVLLICYSIVFLKPDGADAPPCLDLTRDVHHQPTAASCPLFAWPWHRLAPSCRLLRRWRPSPMGLFLHPTLRRPASTFHRPLSTEGHLRTRLTRPFQLRPGRMYKSNRSHRTRRDARIESATLCLAQAGSRPFLT